MKYQPNQKHSIDNSDLISLERILTDYLSENKLALDRLTGATESAMLINYWLDVIAPPAGVGSWGEIARDLTFDEYKKHKEEHEDSWGNKW